MLERLLKSEGVGLVVGYLYFSQAQDLDLSPDSLEWNWSCGNFPTICNDTKSLQMVRKFPQDQFHSSESGDKSRSCA